MKDMQYIRSTGRKYQQINEDLWLIWHRGIVWIGEDVGKKNTSLTNLFLAILTKFFAQNLND